MPLNCDSLKEIEKVFSDCMWEIEDVNSVLIETKYKIADSTERDGILEIMKQEINVSIDIRKSRKL